MTLLRLPSPLRPYVNGLSEIPLRGNTVAEVMEDFISMYPVLRPHLYDERRNLRTFVNLFLQEIHVKEINGMDTLVGDEDILILILTVAGG